MNETEWILWLDDAADCGAGKRQHDNFYRNDSPPRWQARHAGHAIPEYDEKEISNSVLVVSHDITGVSSSNRDPEQNKNQRFDQYAKRIRMRSFPHALINKALPDSFILYKPETLSAETSWFVQIKTISYRGWIVQVRVPARCCHWSDTSCSMISYEPQGYWSG